MECNLPGRLGYLCLLLPLLALAGCASVSPALPSLFGESAEAGQPQQPIPPDMPSATVVMVTQGAPPVAARLPLQEITYVQTALERTGLQDHFRRMKIELFHPLEQGNHRLEIKYDRGRRRVDPTFDYALRPGDRLVVSEDTSTVLDDMLESLAMPFAR